MIDGAEQFDFQKSLRKTIEEIWNKFDTDKNGFLDTEEAHKFFTQCLISFKGKTQYKPRSFQSWMAVLDKDNSGTLCREEVLPFLTKLLVQE